MHNDQLTRALISTLHANREATASRRRALDEARKNGVSSLTKQLTTRLRGAARSHRLAADDVEDVVQIAWLRLLENADQIRTPAAVGRWLETTVRNESLRVLRQGRRSMPIGDDDFLLEREAPVEETAAYDRHECRSALEAAIRRLSPDRRAMMQLMLDEPELGYTQIAHRLGISIGSIGPTRGRCLRLLSQDPRLQRIAEEARA
jgi:RNA polymerase sigma factor (sigma-70 family)